MFFFKPPIGNTRPRSVISPVIPTSLLTGIPVSAEISAVAIVIPADGPSFGTVLLEREYEYHFSHGNSDRSEALLHENVYN